MRSFPTPAVGRGRARAAPGAPVAAWPCWCASSRPLPSPGLRCAGLPPPVAPGRSRIRPPRQHRPTPPRPTGSRDSARRTAHKTRRRRRGWTCARGVPHPRRCAWPYALARRWRQGASCGRYRRGIGRPPGRRRPLRALLSAALPAATPGSAAGDPTRNTKAAKYRSSKFPRRTRLPERRRPRLLPTSCLYLIFLRRWLVASMSSAAGS